MLKICSRFKSTLNNSMQKKILVAFDFDHTIIDKNTDTYIFNLIPKGLPRHLEESRKGSQWTEFMQSVFDHLYKIGKSPTNITEFMKTLKLTAGMHELLSDIEAMENVDAIIISDSNTIFIDIILKHQKLQNSVTSVFTNPAKFDADGKLRIEMFHIQNYCNISSINLCKGQILEDFKKDQEKLGVVYSHVLYVGDGSNDYCPALKLNKQDMVFARSGYTLEKKLEKNDDVKAKSIVWESGITILDHLKQLNMNL